LPTTTYPPFPPLPQPGDAAQLPPGARPALYVQYGSDVTARDQALAQLKANLDGDLAQLRQDLDDARYDLRTPLFWLSLGAFAALVAGGFWLVRLSLSRLRRLSAAVSKVSEKDFRLPVDPARLPRELTPIAERLAETLEQLKRAFEHEKQAAADISHELRTPVAALLTTLDIALRKERSAPEYREGLQDCRATGQQISPLVERLLALARLDAGADVLRPRDVDVAALADQCVNMVRPLAEARGLRLQVRLDSPGTLQADPDKLREILTNLLHNAI